MRPRERLILCGETASQSPDTKAIRLLLGQEKVGDVNLILDVLGVEASLARELPPRLEDLLVIAGYVLGADSAVDRGRPSEADQGRRWIRHFRIRIPVKEADNTNSADLLYEMSKCGFGGIVFGSRSASMARIIRALRETAPDDIVAAFLPSVVWMSTVPDDQLPIPSRTQRKKAPRKGKTAK